MLFLECLLFCHCPCKHAPHSQLRGVVRRLTRKSTSLNAAHAMRDALITVVYRKSTTVHYCIKRYSELLNAWGGAINFFTPPLNKVLID